MEGLKIEYARKPFSKDQIDLKEEAKAEFESRLNKGLSDFIKDINRENGKLVIWHDQGIILGYSIQGISCELQSKIVYPTFP